MTKCYILDSSDDEHVLVIRTEDISLLWSLVNRMSRMRDERIREMGKFLQEELNGRES